MSERRKIMKQPENDQKVIVFRRYATEENDMSEGKKQYNRHLNDLHDVMDACNNIIYQCLSIINEGYSKENNRHNSLRNEVDNIQDVIVRLEGYRFEKLKEYAKEDTQEN
jgi:hypothetical protein